MKHKSKVFKFFIVCKALIENNFRKKIKSIRLDNGGEYAKYIFISYVHLKAFEWNTQFHTHHNRMVWLRGKIDH